MVVTALVVIVVVIMIVAALNGCGHSNSGSSSSSGSSSNDLSHGEGGLFTVEIDDHIFLVLIPFGLRTVLFFQPICQHILLCSHH